MKDCITSKLLSHLLMLLGAKVLLKGWLPGLSTSRVFDCPSDDPPFRTRSSSSSDHEFCWTSAAEQSKYRRCNTASLTSSSAAAPRLHSRAVCSSCSTCVSCWLRVRRQWYSMRGSNAEVSSMAQSQRTTVITRQWEERTWSNRDTRANAIRTVLSPPDTRGPLNWPSSTSSRTQWHKLLFRVESPAHTTWTAEIQTYTSSYDTYWEKQMRPVDSISSSFFILPENECTFLLIKLCEKSESVH